MSVRNAVRPPVRPKNSGNASTQDEAWLNDVGPLVQSKVTLQKEHETVGNVGQQSNYGPLASLLNDSSISEITCIGPHHTFVERNGLLEEVPCAFESEGHMLRVIEQMLRHNGYHLQSEQPIIDTRLANDIQLHAVLPPYAVNGPVLTLRKEMMQEPLALEDLVRSHTLSQAMADVLLACVEGRLNVLICGMRRSGRTTLLNALCAAIPEEERIITIEELPELRLHQKQHIALVTQVEKPTISRQVTVRDLLQSALHMGPERIILGECCGEETGELLHALSLGHNGSLMTMYATDAKDCLTRLETLYQNANSSLPVPMLRRQIAASIDVTVQMLRMPDGSYKVVDIGEVLGSEQDELDVFSIFRYSPGGFDSKAGRVTGEFDACGTEPNILKKLEVMGIFLSHETFITNSSDDTVKLSRMYS